MITSTSTLRGKKYSYFFPGFLVSIMRNSDILTRWKNHLAITFIFSDMTDNQSSQCNAEGMYVLRACNVVLMSFPLLLPRECFTFSALRQGNLTSDFRELNKSDATYFLGDVDGVM